MLWEILFSFIKQAKQNQKHSMCPFYMLYGQYIDLTPVVFTGKVPYVTIKNHLQYKYMYKFIRF